MTVAWAGALVCLLAAGCSCGGDAAAKAAPSSSPGAGFWVLVAVGLFVVPTTLIIIHVALGGRRRNRWFAANTVGEGDGQPGQPVVMTFLPRPAVRYGLWLHMDSSNNSDRFLLTYSAHADGRVLFERTWVAWCFDGLCGRPLTGDMDPWSQPWSSQKGEPPLFEHGWNDLQGATHLLVSFVPPTASPVTVVMRCVPQPGTVMPSARFRVTAGVQKY